MNLIIRSLVVSLGLTLFGLQNQAHAESFIETVGISTTVGTVLGVSTLPFYDQPGDNLANLGYGAALGAVAGLGIWLIHASTRPSERERYQRSWNPENIPFQYANLDPGIDPFRVEIPILNVSL